MSCRETWQWHEDLRMAQFLVCTWAIYTVDSYLRYSTYLLRRWTKRRYQEAHLFFPLLTEQTEANVRQLDYPGFETVRSSSHKWCDVNTMGRGRDPEPSPSSVWEMQLRGMDQRLEKSVTLGYRQRSHLKIRGRADRKVSNDCRTSILR